MTSFSAGRFDYSSMAAGFPMRGMSGMPDMHMRPMRGPRPAGRGGRGGRGGMRGNYGRPPFSNEHHIVTILCDSGRKTDDALWNAWKNAYASAVLADDAFALSGWLYADANACSGRNAWSDARFYANGNASRRHARLDTGYADGNVATRIPTSGIHGSSNDATTGASSSTTGQREGRTR